MRGSDRGRRVAAVAGLVGLLAALGAGGSGAQAQVFQDPFAAYGGVNASARSGGVQISYDVKGVLPLPPPLLEVTVPTSRATSASGPSSLAFGSVAYPGDLVGNLPSLVEQSAPGSGGLIPPYPLATMASSPGGPTSNRQDIGTASATVQASPAGADAVTSMAATDVPGVIELGASTTSTRTGLEDGRVVARARTHVASVSLLFGLIQLQDVVTDVVASSDGTKGGADGTTTIGSASILGLPATIGPDGLTLAPDAPPVLSDVLGLATGAIDDLLAASGLHLALAEVTGSAEGAASTIEGAGVEVRLDVDGSGDGPLAQLLALLPADQLPGAALPGVPVNTSPQALVNLLKETHIARLAIAPATASVDASPAFSGSVEQGTGGGAEPSYDGGPLSGGGGGLGLAPAGYATPLPVLGGQPAAARPSGGGGLVPGRAVSVLLVVLGLLSLPAWGMASARFMDVALADTAPGCVGGNDGTIGPGGSRGGGEPGSDVAGG